MKFKQYFDLNKNLEFEQNTLAFFEANAKLRFGLPSNTVLCFMFHFVTNRKGIPMKRRDSRSRYFLFTLCFLFVLPTLLTAVDGTDHENRRVNLNKQIQLAIEEESKLQAISAEIRSHLTPPKLVQAFVQEYRRTGQSVGFDKLRQKLENSKALKKSMNTGSITGNITVPGDAIQGGLEFFAFDGYGYFKAIGTTSYWEKIYRIDGLPEGEYYILAVSADQIYADELYDNVPAAVFTQESWRTARRVQVSAGGTTENIDFDLALSSMLLVNVYEADGETIADEYSGYFTLTRFDDPATIFSREYYTPGGPGRFNRIFVPMTGDFKLGFKVDEDDPVNWHTNSSKWVTADKITVQTLGDTSDTLSIIMQQPGAASEETAKLSGSVNGNGMITLIFAFSTDDLSLAGLGLSFFSSYNIEDLPPGEYYIYAEDYLGNIEGKECRLGTFYPDAPTPATAEKVTVAAGDWKWGYNITLRKGATIEGQILDETGTPLEKMMIVALDLNLPQATAYDLFTQFHFNIAQTDSSGFYRMAGLFPGEYIIRTLSEFSMGKVWGFPVTEEGPHKGKVVDVFYPDLPNIFEFMQAEKVAVSDTQTVTGINMTLETAKYIRGNLTEAVSGEPVNKVLMVTYLDDTQTPYFAVPKIVSTGEYQLGPFPKGRYRLQATADHENRDFYLPEYYTNAQTYEEATVLEIGESDLENIDFEFDAAGLIQGHVFLAPGYPAGDDTLSNFPVVCFSADDGSYARNAYVQFDGGFRITKLQPGNYKLMALPMASPYAATYYGGGDLFMDASSQVITLEAGQTFEADIELETGAGGISGSVNDQLTGKAVTNCLVLAYDNTGHVLGLAVTDDNDEMAETEATGQYQIQGLRPGNYKVSTFAFTDETGISTAVPPLFIDNENPDLLEMAFTFLEILLVTDMTIYSDAWYEQVHMRSGFQIPELVSYFMTYGIANEYDNARYPFYMPIPFYRNIPENVTPVTVAGTAVTDNINFHLKAAPIEGLILDVEMQQGVSGISEFKLLPNYPNPFNGSTVISFELPRQSKVDVHIYNIRGELVCTLLESENYNAGRHEIRWSGQNSAGIGSPTGMYFILFESENFKQVSKLTFIQ